MKGARVYLALLFFTAAGVWIGKTLGLQPAVLYVAAGFCFALFFAGRITGVFHGPGKSAPGRVLQSISGLLLFGVAGALSATLLIPRYPADTPHFLAGEKGIVTQVVSKGKYEILTLRISGRDCLARIRTDELGFRRGDILKINSPLVPVKQELKPERFNNSGDTLPSAERYSEVLLNRGVLYTSSVRHPSLVFAGHEESFRTKLDNLREDIEIYIEKSGLSLKTASLLSAILLGDREYLDPSLRQHFSDAGVSHVLAVSGMHTGIIAIIILTLFKPLVLTGHRSLRYILSLVLLWVFVLLTGLSPGTFRAAIMTSCLMIGVMSQQKGSAFAYLCLAAVFILLLTPSALTDPGFQLSFVCVASLCVFCEKLNFADPVYHKRLRRVCSYIIPTLTATGATWLIVAYYFGCVPAMFLPANLLILPFVPVYIVCALLYLLSGLCGINAWFLAWLLEKGTAGAEMITSRVSLDGSAVLHLYPKGYTVLLWLAGLVLLGWSLHSISHKRPKYLVSLGLLAASLATLL